jgi:hypothetical protein
MAERERKVSKEVTDAGVNFEFHDGATLECTLSELPEDMVMKLALHGLSQKVGDSYSGEDAANCQTIAETTWKTLMEGNWSSRSGGGGPRISQLAEALARATGKEVQECVATIAEMDDDTKKDLRAHPQIKALIAEIKLEKAKADQEKASAEAGEAPALDLASL